MVQKIFRIGACLKAENNPFWSIDVRKGLEEASKTFRDVRLIYRTPERITLLDEQKKIIDYFIDQNVDAIILAPSDPIALVPSVVKINHAKIPLIIIDSRLDPPLVRKHKLQFNFIGFDDYKGGYDTGKLFLKSLPKYSSVAVIEGYRSGSYTQRVDGFKDAVKNNLVLKSVISANFEEDAAYLKTKILLQQLPDLRGIFCTSDNMALGCLTALFEADRNDVLVSGFDATYAGKLALEKKTLFSTVDTSPEEMGKRAVQSAREVLLGHTIASDQEYFIKVLTQEHIRKHPKTVLQTRNYRLVVPLPQAREFDYSSLHESYDCPIILGKDMVRDVPSRLAKLNADKFYIITDSIVKKLYGDSLLSSLRQENLHSELLFFPVGEQHKTFTILNALAASILDRGITKRSCLVLLGGGVVGNLAGLLASLLMRGIRFVHIPTTVMAQIDSTTGGKQAVNMPHGKNLLGTFYEPEFIYIDQSVIKTLPKREYASGMAEAIKHGLCQSRKLLEYVQKDDYSKVLPETIRLKINLLESDPREQHEGLILVYGHTVGHALETISNHSLNHGEGISIGMVAAAKISLKLGYCSPQLVQFHEGILKRKGLPIRIPPHLNVKDISRYLLYDKKERKKNITFVLLEDVGKVKTVKGGYLISVGGSIIEEVLAELKTH